jgi:hypothetical protein
MGDGDLLGHEAHPLASSQLLIWNRMAEDIDGSVKTIDAHQAGYQSRLPRAVRTQQPKDLAPVDIHRYTVNRNIVTEAFHQTFDNDRFLRHSFTIGPVRL